MRDNLPAAAASEIGTESDDRATVRVTLLTQVKCGLCDQAKGVLADLQHDPALPVRLDVHEVSLDTDQGRALASVAGVIFAPGVLLDGKPFSHGRLSERKLRRTLNRTAR